MQPKQLVRNLRRGTTVELDNKSTATDTRTVILESARRVFVDAGYNQFTMRKVASAAGLSLGNLNYYFPRKGDLLTAVLERVIDRYLEEFNRRIVAAGESPHKPLEAVLEYWIDDLLSQDTTVFFPELWALSNHDTKVAAMTDDLYKRARQPLNTLIPLVNPALSTSQAAQIALVMCAAMEGLTVFAGYNKPWAKQHAVLKRILLDSFTKMVENEGTNDIPPPSGN